MTTNLNVNADLDFKYPGLFFTPIQAKLLKILLRWGSLTRKALRAILNEPRTMIYDNLLKLEKTKLIERYAEKTSIRGRPEVYWRVK